MTQTAMIERGCGHRESVELFGNERSKREMLKAAKAAGCPECGATASTQLHGGEQHSTTEDQAVGPRVKINRYPGRCRDCSRHLRTGEGYIWYGGDVYESHEPGWQMVCRDEAACRAYASDPARLYG